MLSLDHIEKHLIEFTKKAQAAHYHGGLSLNAHAQLLHEPPDRVAKVLDRMYNDPDGKRANPFGCRITQCFIWYMKGISRDWNAYGGNGFQTFRNGNVCTSYAAALKESIALAEQYPDASFTSGGEISTDEPANVRRRLKLPEVTKRMTDDTCIFCEKKER